MTPDLPHSHAAADHGQHAHSAVPYLVVGMALSIFTAVSFVVNGFVRMDPAPISADTGFFIILAVAVVKALLVVTYFMHLKYDWRKVGFMIVPALILGAMMAVVLMPDIVLAWHH